MFELVKTSDKTILYSVATTLVNCTNSYDVKEVIPELVQLAKFSKQHVPEEHPKDKKDFVDMRVKRLLKAGVISALSCMVRADSAILTDQTKELLARVFLALCDNPKDRGTIVAQGGGKALIPLALEGTDVGKVKAAHALAKIAAVSNPDIAFPGQRVYEVVRPLVGLLDTQRDGLQNYEALLGLTNLSGRSDKLRTQGLSSFNLSPQTEIFKERALPDIENYMFENHDQLRQAATECMCNMVVNKEVQERFLADGNDRLKLVVLLCGEDDDKVQNAAAGALAMLTAAHKKLCIKMTQVTSQWLEILQRLCLHDQAAANNLIVLGREDAGAEGIFQNNGVALLLQLLDTKRPELVLAAVRTLSGMCSGHRARATAILHAVGIDRICGLMSVENEEMALAICNLLQAIIDSLSGEDKREHRGKEEALVLDTKKDLKQITSHLLDMLVSKKVSGQGRDQALNLLNKNVPRKDLAIHDNSRTIYVVDNGLRKILKVVGQVPDLPSCLPLTDNTRMLASILINKLYDDLRCDPERDHFRKICEEYITVCKLFL
ncbi:Hypothetical predicted protein [Marmota monax]|uniref:UNC-45/Cro1/She4 central domain-containing protein n=1 Tax=Marmota monax TaxID=9995 RepID=A0A5E4C505_MARMO|nr:Hypothetical predicted protein [Marmota monax]